MGWQLKRRPPEVSRRSYCDALYIAQKGDKHVSAKPLKGFNGAGVLEVVDNHDSNTYRTVYNIRFKEAVSFLHAFQKKSKNGIVTPQKDMDLINLRIKRVMEGLWSARND